MENKTPTRETILSLMDAFVSQRSGMDSRDYGQGRDFDREAYMGDYRPMLQAGKDARVLMRKVESSSVTAETLQAAFERAFMGRLSLKAGENGEWRLEYTTGQYFPTEYRAAACAVLARALWEHYREDNDTGETMRAKFRRMFGRGIQSRWFN